MRKIILFGLVLILLLLSLSSPVFGYGLVSTQNNVTMSNPGYNITLVPIMNFTSMSSDGTTLTINLNSTTMALLLNSSSDFTLSNLVHPLNSNPAYTEDSTINFTVSATAGTLNISAKTPYNTSLYKMYIDNALSSSKYTNTSGWVYFTSSTWSQHDFSIQSAPWLTNSSVTSANSFVVAYPVTITAGFSTDSNVTSSKVRVRNPDLSEANFTMTCTGTSSSICSLLYTVTGNVGSYNILYFYPVDWSGNQRNITTNLGFSTVVAVQGGGAGGASGGSSGGGAPPAPETTPTPTPITTVTPDTKLIFTDIREGATEPQAIDIAKCLTDSLTMSNKCSSYNYGVVVEPFNWWVAIGAYLSALGIIFVQTIRLDKRRELFKETIIYGTMTVLISAILVSVGFNVYIVNYLMDSPEYFYTFLNFGIFGAFISMIGDSYYYRKDKKVYKLKSRISILENL